MAQANCVADHRLWTCHACIGLAENLQAGIVVQSEWGNRICSLTKDDQTDAIVGSLADKLADHLLDGIDAARTLAVRSAKVGSLHRLRDVERQHQITSGFDLLNGMFDELRPREREHHEAPAHWSDNLLQPVRPGNDGSGARREAEALADVFEER